MIKGNLRLDNVVERLKKTDGFVIFGAGEVGRRLCIRLLYAYEIRPVCFWDNNAKNIGDKLFGIPVTKPHKPVDDYIIIVCSGGKGNRSSMLEELGSLNIGRSKTMVFDEQEYLSCLDEDTYASEIQVFYYNRFGRWIDWIHPKRYTEKANILKLDIGKKTFVTRLADKYMVREWVAEVIGRQYLVKNYGVFSDPEDLPIDTLPDAFVLKTNHASGRNIIVKNKSEFDFGQAKKQLAAWLTDNYGFANMQLQYKGIKPVIICEEYLEGVGEDVCEYDIMCFHGEPYYIGCLKASHRKNARMAFYDSDWNMQPFSIGWKKDDEFSPRPDNLIELLDLSRALSKDFEHVRVDWYNMPDGRILFGELTFQTWGGLRPVIPDEYDYVLGELF